MEPFCFCDLRLTPYLFNYNEETEGIEGYETRTCSGGYTPCGHTVFMGTGAYDHFYCPTIFELSELYFQLLSYFNGLDNRLRQYRVSM